jgi:hypothetical protein
MANILICGDSWGCGEWNVTCTEILHTGLEAYLRHDGHSVTNISKGGVSNLDCYNRLSMWFERFGGTGIDTVFVFQTEYTRDFKHSVDSDWNVNVIADLAAQWIERFYMRLSELSQQYNCAIKIIGGCSDTLWFDHMPRDYPGCEIVCQSLTNLLVFDQDRIDIPVLSWYDKLSEPLLDHARQNSIDLKSVLSAINLGFERESLLKENPHVFFPDGHHPNRVGHHKLYEFLKQKCAIST